MAVSTYNPKCTVSIQKMVARRDGQAQRYPSGYPGPGPVIDITPYLGEEGRVFVSKNIFQPMGAFSIVCVDRPHAVFLDTIYGFIEPMDYVEIRMSRTPHLYIGRKLPIVMRGFVQSVTRQELMGPDGKPRRHVIISGRDFGVIFNQIRILRYQAGLDGKSLLTSFNFFEMTGVRARLYKPLEWLTEVLEKVVNPHLQLLAQAAGNASIPQSIVPVVTTTEGKVWVNQDQPDGTLWDVLLKHADLPWNELFVRDGEDNVELVHRPIPFRAADAQGTWIEQGVQTVELPGTEIIDVGIDEVVSLNANRSDIHVANLYRVHYPTGQLLGSAPLMLSYAEQNAHRDTIFLNDPARYPNSNPRLYGTRPMEVQSRMIYDAADFAPINLPAHLQYAAQRNVVDWLHDRRRRLIALNKDNVVFEDGTMVLRGKESIRAGRYVKLTRHKLVAWYYAFAVIHQYQPYQRYTTTVQFVRGTGFLERSRSNSPYTDEGKQGVYP